MKSLYNNKYFKFLTIALLSAFSGTIQLTKKTKDQVFIVTGFEPFHGEQSNPSWDAVSSLPNNVNGIPLLKVKLPVSYEKGYSPLQKAIQEYDPVGVLSVGLADIKGFYAEQYAYNLDDDIWRDNDNAVRRGQLIIPNGPSKLEIINSFPIDKIVTQLSEQGFVINKTNTSWRFLCNHVFYLLLREMNNREIPAGFMHVPHITYYNISQDSAALEHAIKIIVEELPKYSNDLSEDGLIQKRIVRI